MPPEKTEAVEAEQEPVEVDPSDLSEEDLVKAIQSRADEAAEDYWSDAPEEDEQEAEAVAEPEEPEPVTEPTQETQEEGVEAAEPAAERPLEEIQAELAEAKKQAEHYHKISGREAGRAGFLEQQLKKLQQQVEELKSAGTAHPDLGTGYEPEAGFQAVAKAVQPLAESMATMKRFLTEQAINAAGIEFVARRPEANEVQAEVAGLIAKEYQPDLAALLEAADPVLARQKTTEIIEAAFWRVREAKLSAEIESRDRHTADQAADLRKRKLAAAPASAGGGKAAPKPKGQTLDKIEDLKKEIDRRARAAH